MEKRVVGLQNSGGLCEIHTGVKMSLKSLKATKKRETRKHGFETWKATKNEVTWKQTGSVSIFYTLLFTKKVELKIAAATPKLISGFSAIVLGKYMTDVGISKMVTSSTV